MVKVNTKSKSIENADNTLTQVWLECGHLDSHPSFKPIIKYHDLDLDCGGDTFEEAILELAKYVYKKFGSYKKDCYGMDFKGLSFEKRNKK